MNKRYVSATGNACQPLCFCDVVTRFRNVSVCGFLSFRSVKALIKYKKVIVFFKENAALLYHGIILVGLCFFFVFV